MTHITLKQNLDNQMCLSGKESTCNAGDAGSIPEWKKIPWRRNNPLRWRLSHQVMF